MTSKKSYRARSARNVALESPKISLTKGREVLHGVGADGVGVKFPIFAVNCCCLPLSFRRRREKRRKTKKIEEKRKNRKKGKAA